MNVCVPLNIPRQGQMTNLSITLCRCYLRSLCLYHRCSWFTQRPC